MVGHGPNTPIDARMVDDAAAVDIVSKRNDRLRRAQDRQRRPLSNLFCSGRYTVEKNTKARP